MAASTLLAADVRADEFRWIGWPEYLLDATEDLLIDEVNVRITCGEFRAILNLPPDWNVEITRPVSGTSELRASSARDASHLPNLRPLQASIGITVEQRGCFNIFAQIISLKTQYELSRGKLSLKRRPDASSFEMPGSQLPPPAPSSPSPAPQPSASEPTAPPKDR